MKEAKLIFSPSGTSVHIVFANDKESLDFDSKEEILFAISASFERGKITSNEKKHLLKEVMLAQHLPNHNRRVSLLPLLLLSALLGTDTVEQEEKILSPYVQMCSCGHPTPHAYIHAENGDQVSLPFQFKPGGLESVERLLSANRITEGESAGLNTLIDLLSLPETPLWN